jgi:hypothetical protein
MEGMAAKVEQTRFIHPNTAQEITRFIDRHWYDCDMAECSTQLQARDRAARNHLKTLIAEKTPLTDFAGPESKIFPSTMLASSPPVRQWAQSRSERVSRRLSNAITELSRRPP